MLEDDDIIQFEVDVEDNVAFDSFRFDFLKSKVKVCYGASDKSIL